MAVVDNGIYLDKAKAIVIKNGTVYLFDSSIKAIDKYCELKEKSNKNDSIQLFYRDKIVSKLKG